MYVTPYRISWIIYERQNLAPPFLSIFFSESKSITSKIFMPVQKTIVAEKIKCIGTGNQMLNRNFFTYNFPGKCLHTNYSIHVICMILLIGEKNNNLSFKFLRAIDFYI